MGSCMKVVIIMMVVILGSMVEMMISSTTSLTAECGQAIQKVTSCLTYATGKAVEPTKVCCDAVNGIKEKQPVCLCFFIGQAHNGSQEMKSLGIKETKLLQLPSACHLTNTTTTNCPKLLGISPTSPAAAIFMNKSETPTSSAHKSMCSKQQYAVFVAIFLSFLVFFLILLPVGIY